MDRARRATQWTRRLYLLIACCAITCGCTKAPRQPNYYVDQGRICITRDVKASGDIDRESAPGRYLEGKVPLLMRVEAPLGSSSCNEPVEQYCEAQLRGQELMVRSRFRWRRSRSKFCTDDVQWMVAVCDAPALEERSYTVRHGDRSYTLTIPGELPGGCLGE